MNKKELVDAVATATGQTKKETKLTLDALTDTIGESLAGHDKVSLVGFGSFDVVQRAARKGRNPKTGEDLDIPAKNVVKFKASKNLKEAVGS